MFHAISIKPGENHVSSLDMVWHLRTAALDKSATLKASSGDSVKATAVCFSNDGAEHTLCTLRPFTCEQQSLDVMIHPDQQVQFSVSGSHVVHLFGTLMEDEEDEEYEGSDGSSFDMSQLDDSQDDDDDSDDSDSDEIEMMGDRDQSYGTMALQALVAGGDLEDEDDSDDSANLWDAEDDEEDDEDDEEDNDFDDETDSNEEDDDDVMQGVTEEEFAILKKKAQNLKVRREVKSLPAAKPAKADHHDENGEPKAKRKPAAMESPITSPEKKAAKPSASTTPKDQKQQKAKQEQKSPAAKKEAASPLQKLAGGVTAKTIKPGTGKGCKPGQRVFMRYRGRLAHNNKEFDSNFTSGKPFAFRLGKGEVIKGWDEGVKGMKAGEVRELKIPPGFGYGARGAPPSIPGNSTLNFTVELLRFK